MSSSALGYVSHCKFLVRSRHSSSIVKDIEKLGFKVKLNGDIVECTHTSCPTRDVFVDFFDILSGQRTRTPSENEEDEDSFEVIDECGWNTAANNIVERGKSDTREMGRREAEEGSDIPSNKQETLTKESTLVNHDDDQPNHTFKHGRSNEVSGFSRVESKNYLTNDDGKRTDLGDVIKGVAPVNSTLDDSARKSALGTRDSSHIGAESGHISNYDFGQRKEFEYYRTDIKTGKVREGECSVDIAHPNDPLGPGDTASCNSSSEMCKFEKIPPIEVDKRKITKKEKDPGDDGKSRDALSSSDEGARQNLVTDHTDNKEIDGQDDMTTKKKDDYGEVETSRPHLCKSETALAGQRRSDDVSCIPRDNNQKTRIKEIGGEDVGEGVTPYIRNPNHPKPSRQNSVTEPTDCKKLEVQNIADTKYDGERETDEKTESSIVTSTQPGNLNSYSGHALEYPSIKHCETNIGSENKENGENIHAPICSDSSIGHKEMEIGDNGANKTCSPPTLKREKRGLRCNDTIGNAAQNITPHSDEETGDEVGPPHSESNSDEKEYQSGKPPPRKEDSDYLAQSTSRGDRKNTESLSTKREPGREKLQRCRNKKEQQPSHKPHVDNAVVGHTVDYPNADSIPEHEENQDNVAATPYEDEEEQSCAVTSFVFSRGELKIVQNYFKDDNNIHPFLEKLKYENENDSYCIEVCNEGAVEKLNNFKKNIKDRKINRSFRSEIKSEWNDKIHCNNLGDHVTLTAHIDTLKKIEEHCPELFSRENLSKTESMSQDRYLQNERVKDIPTATGGQEPEKETDRNESENRSVFIGRKSGVHVEIYNANIIDLKVDVIVNAANRKLKHGSGVAKAISQGAGPALKRECEKRIEREGFLEVTHNFASVGGRLPCKKVYHAVGPKWDDYKTASYGKCEHDLTCTILRCLNQAESDRYQSIAFPSISSARFKVPQEICVQSYMEAVKIFDNSRKSDCLEDVHFVDVNENMVKSILDQFRRHWDEPLDTQKIYNFNSMFHSLSSCTASASTSDSGNDASRGYKKQATNKSRSFDFDHQSHASAGTSKVGNARSDYRRCPSYDMSSEHVSSSKPTHSRDTRDTNQYDDRSTGGDTTRASRHGFASARPTQWDQSGYANQYDDSARSASGDTTLVTSHTDTQRAQSRGTDHYGHKSAIGDTTRAPRHGFASARPTQWDQSGYANQYDDSARSASGDTTLVPSHTDTQRAQSRGTDHYGHKSASGDTTLVPSHTDTQRAQSRGTDHYGHKSASGDTTLVPSHTDTQRAQSRGTDHYGHKSARGDAAASPKQGLYPDLQPSNDSDSNEDTPYKTCSICTETKKSFETCPSCYKYTCTTCFEKVPRCPFCMRIKGILTGDMPAGIMTVNTLMRGHCPPHLRSGLLEIRYYFYHISLLKPFRIAYLPHSEYGLNVLRLFMLAFMRRLTFSRGTSLTTGRENQLVWNGIHHKTSLKPGDPHGYPDDTYLQRVLEELENKGVTFKSITDEEKRYSRICGFWTIGDTKSTATIYVH